MPDCPTTRFLGKPVTRRHRVTMASSGLVMTMTKASGAYCRTPSDTWVMILALVPRRSSRLMPGLRAMPAVTMHTSAPAMSSYRVVPVMSASKPSMGADWSRSSALPWGRPSTTSNSTTSPSFLRAHRWAMVPPMLPPPINAILRLEMAMTTTGYMFATMASPNSEHFSSFAPVISRSKS